MLPLSLGKEWVLSSPSSFSSGPMEKTKIRFIASCVLEYYEQLWFPFLTFFHTASFFYFKQSLHLDLGKGL